MIAAFAWALRRARGVGGALALGAAVHVFIGMIEAPLPVRPYLARMPRGELVSLMTCGMAGVAGMVMVIYAGFLAPIIPNALGDVLIASVIVRRQRSQWLRFMVPFPPPQPDAAGDERAAGKRARCAGSRHARWHPDIGRYPGGARRCGCRGSLC